MSQHELLALAREAGFKFNKYGLLQADEGNELDANDMLARFAELVAAREREACAVAAWNHFMTTCKKRGTSPAEVGAWLACDAIRARGAA